MKIVVIGGSGLIGSKLVNKLGEQGHNAVAASPDSGVDTLTGAGLDAALYFGISPDERALLPGAGARVAETRFSDWLDQQLATA